MKLCAGILFRFQWQIERLWSYFCLGPGLSSISPLILIISPCNRIWWINNITTKLWTDLLGKIWIFLTLAFTFFTAKQKNNKLKKIGFVSNKSSKLWKSSLGNNLPEKMLDEFTQTHFMKLKTPLSLRYWIKLTGITYEERFETLLKAISKYQ